jgi:hypothetical protein
VDELQVPAGVVALAEQGCHRRRQGGVPQPRVPVVELPVVPRRLGQAGGWCGDDRAGRPPG